MSPIRAWLEAEGLARYAEAFAAQDISLDLLPDLSDADLLKLGVASLGDRKRLLKAIAAAQWAIAPTSAAGLRREPDGSSGAAPAFPQTLRSDLGERRHATVVFSDLVGYTALSEAFDPEEVEAVMAQVKREAIAVVERHGGHVNQFVGDEVMAMFGVPVARRDDPQRAVRAALELHRAVDAIAAGLTAKLGRVLSMHTGIQSGLVVARRSDWRSGDYSVTGDAVNTAARLRGLARPGEVVVSPQIWQQVSDGFEAEAGAPVEVKGKEQPLVPWRIVGKRVVNRVGSRLLVGRAAEMQKFGRLIEACQPSRRGSVVVVRGEPGIGKSRLAAEFMSTARGQGFECHGTAILDFGASTGHDAIRRLAQSLLGLSAEPDERGRADAIAAFASAPGGARHAPFLYDLLDAVMPGPVRALLSAIDVRAWQASTRDALCELARSRGSSASMLLLVEDIHWADSWTLDQLGALAALTSTEPLLLIVTTRFGGDPSAGDWRHALRGLRVCSIDLGSLSQEDSLQLAAGAVSISQTFLRSCVERAEGNPLFLEHLLLSAGDGGRAALPGSIHALIQARMDWLPPLDKDALQAAAVWGLRMPLEALRHLLGRPAYDAHSLVDQFLLRPDGDELAFSHALIREGAYASLLHARRRELHRSAAQWVESRDVALAAEHYERAQDERAAQCYLRASESLIEKFKHAEALSLVERALPLARASSVLFGLRLAHANLLLENARAAESIEAGRAALEVAQSGADHALALIEIASGMRMANRHDEGLALLDEAQPLAEAAGMALELSRLHHLRGNLLYAMNRASECQRAHEQALEFARRADSVEAQAKALGGIGDAHYAQARLNTAHEFFARCVALARERGMLRVEASYLTMLGVTSCFQMDIAGCLQATATVIELAQRISHQRAELLARWLHIFADGWICGNAHGALPHAERVLAIARSFGNPLMEAFYWTSRAMLALRDGRKEVARSHAARAIEVVGENGLSFLGAHAYGLLANAEADQASRTKALAAGEKVLSQGAPIHNYFTFYDLAIRSSLEDERWEAAERYCALLDAYSVAEPFIWGQFASARGRALCRAGRGESGTAVLAELTTLRTQAQDARCLGYLDQLDAAILRVARQTTTRGALPSGNE